jgi:tRNA threonylcarbamoyladenosine biosynthesis protein TsaE
MSGDSQKNRVTWYLANEADSARFARSLAVCINAPLLLTFSGDIGAGKTTIIRALLKQLGVQSAIKSPTFSLVESYSCAVGVFHHFDLYRLHQKEELEYLGFRDYFSNDSICCIEWPEHAGNLLPNVDIRFKLEIKGTGREIQIDALSRSGENILNSLAE